jgi:hypothetical protein
MLKNKGIAGAYHDENISVGVLLENPLDYELEASTRQNEQFSRSGLPN